MLDLRAALAFAALAFFALFPSSGVDARDSAHAVPGNRARHLSEAELDQLVAPVALYPDAIIAKVLAASTHPLEVGALHRWLDRHPGLSGGALDEALAREPWDDRVKALARFPSVVAVMDGEPEWMQRLADAFLSDEAGVMAAVQRLRTRTLNSGSLGDADFVLRLDVHEQYMACGAQRKAGETCAPDPVRE